MDFSWTPHDRMKVSPNFSHEIQEELYNLLTMIQTYETNDLTKRRVSSEIDLLFGFRIKKIEEILRARALSINPDSFFDSWGPILHNGAQTWIGLDFQILQSTYHDLFSIFEEIKPKKNEHFIDLGAGYGRMGLFLHFFYPQTSFLGIELVDERVMEGNRVYANIGLKNKTMVCSDLSQLDHLPEANYYFIYDFGSEEHIRRILDQFQLLKTFTLIVKGQICHRIIKKYYQFHEEIQVKECDDVFIFKK